MEIVIILLIILFFINAYWPNEDKSLNLKLDKIMATLQEIAQKADELQAALDAEQGQIAEAIAQLTETNEQLKALVADGGTAEERQALADKLDAIAEDLKSTIPDGTAPVEPEPEQPTEPTEPEEQV